MSKFFFFLDQPMKTMDYEFKAHSKNQSSDMKEYVLQSLNHDHNYDCTLRVFIYY